MKELPVSILIASWSGEEAIELCIESILKRTDKDIPYEIHVLDSTGKDSREREYSLKQKKAGRIKLITREKRQQQYEALPTLIKKCSTKWAVILDSDVEIISGDWLKFLFTYFKTDKDLLAGVYDPPRYYYCTHLATKKKGWEIWGPRIMPFCMLMNLSLYKSIATPYDWLWTEYRWGDFLWPEEYEETFQMSDIMPHLNIPKRDNVFNLVTDVGARFLRIARSHGLSIPVISRSLLETKMRHMEMLSHKRPGRRARKAAKSYKFQSRLKKLRKET